MNTHSKRLLAGVAFAAMTMAVPAFAQDDVAQDEAQSSSGGLGDIIVTATKRGSAQNVQDVPIAITAFGSNELDSIHARSIASVSYAVPNASLESVGTTPGYANFSIRGLGINSSIPSIEITSVVGANSSRMMPPISLPQSFANTSTSGSSAAIVRVHAWTIPEAIFRSSE